MHPGLHPKLGCQASVSICVEVCSHGDRPCDGLPSPALDWVKGTAFSLGGAFGVVAEEKGSDIIGPTSSLIINQL